MSQCNTYRVVIVKTFTSGEREKSMTKTSETLKVEQQLAFYTNKIGIYGIKEVSLRKYAYGAIDERVDYITIDNTSVIRCYEIKVTKTDFLSTAHLSWWGDYNYLVVTDALLPQIDKLPEYSKLVFSGVGIIAVSLESNKVTFVRKPKKKQVSISQRTAVIESMVKSASNQLREIYLSK